MAEIAIITTARGVANAAQEGAVAAFADAAGAGLVDTDVVVTTRIGGLPEDPTTWEAEGVLAAHEAASNAAQAAGVAAFPEAAAAGLVTTHSEVTWPEWGGH